MFSFNSFIMSCVSFLISPCLRALLCPESLYSHCFWTTTPATRPVFAACAKTLSAPQHTPLPEDDCTEHEPCSGNMSDSTPPCSSESTSSVSLAALPEPSSKRSSEILP